MEWWRILECSFGCLFEYLKKITLDNYELISGLDGKVKKLVGDLDKINDYKKIDVDNDELHQQADDVMSQAEDAIGTYDIWQSSQQGRGVGSQAFHVLKCIPHLRQIDEQVEKVSADITNFCEKLARPGSEGLRIEEAANRARLRESKEPSQTTVVGGDNVVGFEDEAKTVIELLTGESKELEIISIIGMFGLGKTTLAKKVLNDPRVEYEEFSPKVFVNVSHEYDIKKVFINILSDLKFQITPNMPDKEIVEKLREELGGTRKYLIVLDDVYNTTAWDDLKDAFPNNKTGSRLLITSRDKRVASRAYPWKNPYELRLMTTNESQKLLRTKVFRENACPTQLEDYESRILKKCGGLPLAIVVVAGILLDRPESDYWWEKVAKSVDDYVARNESNFNNVINLSLNHLPRHRKTCFLYLGVFCKDFEIPVWKLLRLWIDEGFIREEGDRNLEDIAEDYLEDLVDRSLLMVERRWNGQIKTCRIHDTLRDFCKKEALKQNLFIEIKRFDQSTFLSEDQKLHSYMRICIHSNVYNYVASKPSGYRVRSFLTFSKEEITVPVGLISSIPKAFKLLRVLDVKSLKFTNFPPELIDLVLLKYIAMFCDFKTIPKEFSKLRKLQTITIDTTSDTLEIKADISKLTLLRHLLSNASASLEKGTVPPVANANLQTLCTISLESCTVELFERYPGLKKLGIRGKLATVIMANGESALFETLVKLGFLENLKLINDETCPLHVLPPETNFPRNLRRLTMMNTFLGWSQISTLGKLQKLEVLKLKENAFDGELWDTEDGGFRCLKVLYIGYTQKLELWKASASHFPMLTSLYLRHCANLEAIPHGIFDIPSLQTVDLYCCAKPSVATSARKILVLKFQQAQQKNDKTSLFKLAVYPPDQ